jgi:hypothetical protein
LSHEQSQTKDPGPQIEIPTLKSLYIETYFGETRLSSATGFLLARNQSSHCALITNRHVVTGRHQETSACLSKQGAIPDAIVIHFHKEGSALREWQPIRLPLFRPDGSKYWIEHPTMGANADVVAMNVRWGSDVAKYPYYLDLELDNVKIALSPAEPVSVIGFPFGLSSYGKFPVWATGFLAQDIDLIADEKPIFLIDCRARQGQSGSPVIAFRNTGVRIRQGDRIAVRLTPEPKWEFLGIYSGRINAESDLGTVWHVRALGELLDAAETDYVTRAKMQAASG